MDLSSVATLFVTILNANCGIISQPALRFAYHNLKSSQNILCDYSPIFSFKIISLTDR